MCEFYDHDTFVTREKEVKDALDSGANRGELVAKLAAERDAAKDNETKWMAKDLAFLAAAYTPKTPVTA